MVYTVSWLRQLGIGKENLIDKFSCLLLGRLSVLCYDLRFVLKNSVPRTGAGNVNTQK